MTSNTFSDFLSRDCKHDNHHQCIGKWHGLGMIIYCYCDCHKKKGNVLEDEGGFVTNTELSPYQEMTDHRELEIDDHTSSTHIKAKSSSQKPAQEYDYSSTISHYNDNIIPEQTLAEYDKRDLQSQQLSKTGNKNPVEIIRKNPTNIKYITKYEFRNMKQMTLDSFF